MNTLAGILLWSLVQGSGGATQLAFIDQPNASTLEHGQYLIGLRLQNEGGAILNLGVGFFNQFTVGASYGGLHFIGTGKPVFYPMVQFQARALVMKEAEMMPSVLLGFDTQGFGAHSGGRFAIRSKGIFLALGKRLGPDDYRTSGALGANFCLENPKGVSGFVGVEQHVLSNLALLADYDLGLGDPDTRRRGFLNCGVRWVFAQSLALEFDLRDLLGNSKTADNRFNRIVKIGFEQWF